MPLGYGHKQLPDLKFHKLWSRQDSAVSRLRQIGKLLLTISLRDCGCVAVTHAKRVEALCLPSLEEERDRLLARNPGDELWVEESGEFHELEIELDER